MREGEIGKKRLDLDAAEGGEPETGTETGIPRPSPQNGVNSLTSSQISRGEPETRRLPNRFFYRRKKSLPDVGSIASSVIPIRSASDTANMVTHLWVSQTELEGKVTDTKIDVMQVWQKQDGGWKLLARASHRLPQQAQRRLGSRPSPLGRGSGPRAV